MVTTQFDTTKSNGHLWEKRMYAAVDSLNAIGTTLLSNRDINKVQITYSNKSVEAFYKVTDQNPKIRVLINIDPDAKELITHHNLFQGKIELFTDGRSFLFKIGIKYETLPGAYIEMEDAFGTADDINDRVLEGIKHVKEFCSKKEMYGRFLRETGLTGIQKRFLNEGMVLNLPVFVHTE